MNRLLVAALASTVTATALVQRGAIGTVCKSPSGKGVCGSTVAATCNGYYLPGYCPGDNTIQCCITATNTSCTTPDGPGLCGRTEAGTCNGFYTAGFCPGDRNFQCCIPTDDPAPDTPDGDDSDEADVVTTPITDEIPELAFDLDTEIAANNTITGDEVDLDDEEDPLISTRAAAKLTKGQLIVKAAEKWLGKKYVWGGGTCSGPSNGGFDCSGLVLHAVCKVTKKSLPHKAQFQYNLKRGKHVPLSKIKPGDALFWAYGKNCKSRIHHVAIYIGKNKKGVRQVIHAPHTGSHVKKADIWTRELCGSAVRFW